MKFLSPDVSRVGPRAEVVRRDRAGAEVVAGCPAALREDLVGLLGAGAVLGRAIDLVRYASDASPYRLIPQVVVQPRSAGEVAALLGYARQSGRHVTFRAAGTSLNGQAQGDDILVDVRRYWAGVRVQDGGARVRLRPGTIIGRVNAVLARYGRRLGPDPASSSASTIGGAIANNASGFAAGTTETAYQTLRSATIVLSSGTVIDTGGPDPDGLLAAREPAIAKGLMAIKAAIERDTDLRDRIRRKYEIKNTNGYRLDAFLDGASPAGILQRLIVGSQGTLGFVAEAILNTLPLQAARADALLLFPTVADAAAVVPEFVHAGAQICELLDSLTLKGASLLPSGDKEWMALPDEAAALLVEVRADGDQQLAGMLTAAEQVAGRCKLLKPGAFTRDRPTIARYWQMREGLLAIGGSQRPPGTSLLIEDMCVPPDRIAEAVGDVRALLAKYGFTPSVQGHASAGNLHFALTPRLDDPADRNRYDDFMHEASELILSKYDGSLKAEHGTGRNMAPYVAREWGRQAWQLMWQLRRLLDPHEVLSPDVMLSRDPQIHLAHLHTVPKIDHEVDHCIECGFCEPVCPSRDLTMTPRQRIAVRREMVRQPTGSPVRNKLLEQYDYDAIQTCAGDGSCAMACPLGIDTGTLMKQLRHSQHTRRAELIAYSMAKRWATIERTARWAVAAGGAITTIAGPGVMRGLTGTLRLAISNDLMPTWLPEMPHPAPGRLPTTDQPTATAVYFPACINRIFGAARGTHHRNLPQAMVTLSQRAGSPVWIPDDVAGTCCATIWHSKGYRAANTYMANKAIENMWRWSDNGRLPIIIDATSCTLASGFHDRAVAGLIVYMRKCL